MTGYIKWRCEHVGYLRLGPNCRAYGDPWTWGAQVVKASETVAFIEGLNGTITVEQWRAGSVVLAAQGFERVRFDRWNEDQRVMVTHERAIGRQRRESEGPTRVTASGPSKEWHMADYELTLSFESKNKETGKVGKTVQTLEGDAALRRSIQRDLLKMQGEWLDADEAASKAGK